MTAAGNSRRKGFISILVILFLLSIAHAEGQVSYTRKQVRAFRLVKDLYTDLPDSATKIYYNIMGKIGGKVSQYNGKGDTLNADARLLMSTADAGSKVYLDLIYEKRSLLHTYSLAFIVVK